MHRSAKPVQVYDWKLSFYSDVVYEWFLKFTEHQSPGGLIKAQIAGPHPQHTIQSVWDEAWEFAF